MITLQMRPGTGRDHCAAFQPCGWGGGKYNRLRLNSRAVHLTVITPRPPFVAFFWPKGEDEMNQRKLSQTDLRLAFMLRALRRRQRLTQMQVAAALGVSFQMIQKYEHGQARIPVSRLVVFAQLVGVPVEDFLVPATP